MPVKNAGPYLKPCIDSIRAQSFNNWELIAINDNSTDGSDEVLEEYTQLDKRMITAHSKGTGIVAALQTGYALSSGNCIHRMDADDLMPVNKLEKMISVAAQGAVVTGKVKYFCDEYEVGNGFRKYEGWLNGLMEGGEFWRDAFIECSIPSSAWMIDRTDFELIGGFKSSLMPEDYDLSFRIMEHKLDVIKIQEVIHFWRDSSSRTSRNEEQYFPMAYLPLKVHYFLKLYRTEKKSLVLWGAGKKGKQVAKELIERNVPFDWITGNINKVGKDIYGVVLQDEEVIKDENIQIILALSSPKEQCVIQKRLNGMNKNQNKDYFWFF